MVLGLVHCHASAGCCARARVSKRFHSGNGYDSRVGNSVHEQWAHESGMKQKSGLMTTTRTMAAPTNNATRKLRAKWAPSCLAVSHYMQCVCVCSRCSVLYCTGWMCDIYGHRWCWCATCFEHKGLCRLLHLLYSLFTFRRYAQHAIRSSNMHSLTKDSSYTCPSHRALLME